VAAVHLGAAYRYMGQYEEALDALQKAAPAEPALQAERFAELARVSIARNDYAAAASALESAVALDDTDASAQLELGTLYLQFLGQPDRGRLHLRRSLELDPDQPRAVEIRQLLNR
jgi:Flp pilus assembly protein TadD